MKDVAKVGYPRKGGILFVPALRDIRVRIAADPSWVSDFEGSLPKALAVSEIIPLLHVTSSLAVREDITRRAAGSNVEPIAWRRRSQKTNDAEDVFGWSEEPKTYFYAGRACPDFGGVVLAFDSECEKSRKGSAAPFDTGGIIHGHIAISSGLVDPDSLRQFVADSQIDIVQWRENFSVYLAAYFFPLQHYWKSRPYRPDPDGIFDNSCNQWRAWVFEILLEGLQDFGQAVAWCGSRDNSSSIRKALINTVSPFSFAPYAKLVDRDLCPGGADDYIEVMEDWVVAQLVL
jgi:hypothetical protein